MISLHEQVCVDAYAARCHIIWRQWPSKTAEERQAAFIEAITHVAGLLMYPPNFKFAVMDAGTDGSFGQTFWRLKINRSLPEDNAITLKDFINLCDTVYHETRHAEQYFRIAQGLAVGRLEFPKATGAPVSDVGMGQSLKIQRLLRIPLDVAQRAINSKDQYQKFASLPRARYCIVGSGLNWDATVDDWLELSYHSTRSDFSQQGQDADGGVLEKQFYFRSVEEVDAFACGTAVTEKLKAEIGNYEANKDKPRTDPVFGVTPLRRARVLPLSAMQWKTKTTRNVLHFRSADLTALDKALADYERTPSTANFAALRAAFNKWSQNNPKEASTRNVDLCVTHLKTFVDAA